MTEQEIVDMLNRNRPPAIAKLGSEVTRLLDDGERLEIRFTIDDSFCHSGDIVQGGYVAAMLDASMAHVVFAKIQRFAIVATLDINVSYLEIARPGNLFARARVLKLGKTVAFLSAELFDANELLIARATSTARVILDVPDDFIPH